MTETTDRRLLRGAQSRRAIARRAADLASVDGLTAVSIGRLATDLGISKSGVQTLFGTKEALQVAAAQAARAAFVDAVVTPASTAPPGVARLRALTGRWIDYVQAPLFPGGCFWAANVPEFDSRPGTVRDTLVEHRRAWMALLTGEVRVAVEAGDVAAPDPELTAFQIDAVLVAANSALRLGDAGGADKARRVVEGLLDPA